MCQIASSQFDLHDAKWIVSTSQQLKMEFPGSVYNLIKQIKVILINAGKQFSANQRASDSGRPPWK